MQLNIPIWSNDKKLKQQIRVKIYSTVELTGYYNELKENKKE